MSSSAADVVDDRKLQTLTSPKNTSSSAHLRKVKKPLIERRRRERINECLDQLKSLVLQATNREESRYTKMEKADILEMVVAYLRSTRQHVTMLSRSQSFAPSPFSHYDNSDDNTTTTTTTPSDTNHNDNNNDNVDKDELYAAGFADCARRVAQFLSVRQVRTSTSDLQPAAESSAITASCTAEARPSPDSSATTSSGGNSLVDRHGSLIPGSPPTVDWSGNPVSPRHTRTDVDGRATDQKLNEDELCVYRPMQSPQQHAQRQPVGEAMMTDECDGNVRNDLRHSLTMTMMSGLLTNAAVWRPW